MKDNKIVDIISSIFSKFFSWLKIDEIYIKKYFEKKKKKKKKKKKRKIRNLFQIPFLPEAI